MTYQDREKIYFFDTIKELTGGDFTKALTKEEIVVRAATKIKRNRADDLFKKLTAEGEKYLDDVEQKTYTLSDSGKNYYEFLIDQLEKESLDKQLVKSNINLRKWTIGNIIIGLLFAATTLIFIVSNWDINKRRELREASKETKNNTLKSDTPQSDIKDKKDSLRIYFNQADTVKVKIVK